MRATFYLDPDISRARAREFDITVIVKQWETFDISQRLKLTVVVIDINFNDIRSRQPLPKHREGAPHELDFENSSCAPDL
jgi:hypothetical protein